MNKVPTFNENNVQFTINSILKDIFSSATCLRDCITSYFNPKYRAKFQEIRNLLKTLKISRVLFVGNSFNYFSSFIATHCLKTADKLNYNFTWESFEISEFYDYILPKKRDEGILYIFISKSGRSHLLIRIIEELHLLKVNPNLIWLVTNSPDAEISKYCGFLFPTYVKEELVHGTKSFQNALFVVYLISQILLDKDPLNDSNFHFFEDLIRKMSEFKNVHQEVTRKIFDFLGYDFKFLYFISKGVSNSSAYNSALLANSLYKISCEGILLGHFFLGPFKVVNNDIRCFLILNKDLGDGSKELIQSQIEIITNQLGALVLISNNEQLITSLKYNSRVLSIFYKCEISALTPIFESYIIQIILLQFAKIKKIFL